MRTGNRTNADARLVASIYTCNLSMTIQRMFIGIIHSLSPHFLPVELCLFGKGRLQCARQLLSPVHPVQFQFMSPFVDLSNSSTQPVKNACLNYFPCLFAFLPFLPSFFHSIHPFSHSLSGFSYFYTRLPLCDDASHYNAMHTARFLPISITPFIDFPSHNQSNLEFLSLLPPSRAIFIECN